MTDQNRRLRVNVIGLTDTGLVRGNNEDAFLIRDLTGNVEITEPRVFEYDSNTRGSLFLVADGMGGAAGGEVASKMAVESVADQLQVSEYRDLESFAGALNRAIHAAHRAIFGESRRDQRLRGMGTTLTAAGIFGTAVLFAQVGDSRAYLVRGERIAQMTNDQSLIEKLVASGFVTREGAKTHPQRNVILQALGAQEQIDVVFTMSELKRGDLLVLCSDGLSGKLAEQELHEIVEQSSDPKDCCEKMISLACDRGGEDNITVIVAKFDGELLPCPQPGEMIGCREFVLGDAKMSSAS